MNFDQFLASVLATIIGFGLTLLGQAVYDWLKSRSAAQQCVKSLTHELQSIEKKLKSISTKNDLDEPDLAPNMVLRTPVWDGITDAYELNMLKDKNKSHEWYKFLFTSYNLIREFNKWSEIYTNDYLKQYKENKESVEKEVIDLYITTFNNAHKNEQIKTWEQGLARWAHMQTCKNLAIYCIYLESIKEEILTGSESENEPTLGLPRLISKLNEVAGGNKDGHRRNI